MPLRSATWLALLCCPRLFASTEYFKIQIVDDQTGRGVPLIELRTVNSISHWTDSAGVIAFHEPGLMNREVYFHVQGHGYTYPKDFFDNRGVRLTPTAGGSATVKVKRVNIAERLYRMTGQGIYRDTLLLGEKPPIHEAALNGEVMGQDTVIAALYRGQLYWFWGDTERASYPLGNFGSSGATSEPSDDPAVGINLRYFTNEVGFSKPMCPYPKEGLRWIEGLMTLPDSNGVERLIARVARHKNLSEIYDWRLMIFNDDKQEFESVKRWDIQDPHESAHPFRAKVDGVEYLFIYPDYRVKAELNALYDLENYEAFDGTSWKRGAKRNRGPISSKDVETHKEVQLRRGSVSWNAFRKRWIMIASAKAGEIWYSEAFSPLGPWNYARKIVSHENYNFYNPTHHPFFDQEAGRVIYFEGTYTASFSSAKSKTPRYDYNQIMYRLALDDPRLKLPAPEVSAAAVLIEPR
ncbi:MAG TPA: hypothetical protein VJ063_20270 [Verrucomicrobiae bacterium]|nr:hypothetical protein [Verrucomicrobiae bacterium]